MKKYILQKDTPELKAGAVFEWNAFPQLVYISKDQYGLETFYSAKHVENNPEWFLPEDEFGKWIPTRERWPSISGQYLGCFAESHPVSPRKRIQTLSFNKNDATWHNGIYYVFDPIAWMPLPKPYQP